MTIEPPDGTAIAVQGRCSSTLCILLQGVCRMQSTTGKHTVQLRDVTGVRSFGEASIFCCSPPAYTITTQHSCKLLAIEAPDIFSAIKESDALNIASRVQHPLSTLTPHSEQLAVEHIRAELVEAAHNAQVLTQPYRKPHGCAMIE